MLSRGYIPIGKLKQAYELSDNDVTALMAELLPNHVFPYVLWKNAHTQFWQLSLRECTQRYQVQEPPFPETEALPEIHFPTSLYEMRMKRFFIDISRIIKIAELEKGTDYIIEATYGASGFPFKEQKEAFFYALRQEENSLENWQRTSGPLKINSMEAAGDCYIPYWFFDTIVVDKAAAIVYLDGSGYRLEHEVKGITHALVASIIDSSAGKTPGTLSASQPQEQLTVQSSTGSKKDKDRIHASRQVCEEVTKQLHQEKQVFENDKTHWKQNLLFDNGKTNWKTFINAVETRLGSKPHYDTTREEWKKVPDSLKHNGRMREQ